MVITDALNTPAAFQPIWSTEQLAAAQAADPEINPVIRYLVDHELPDDDKERKRIMTFGDICQMVDGVLYRIDRVKQRHVIRLLTPTSLRAEALHSAHDESGHPGRDRTKTNLARSQSWLGMFSDVDKWVSACKECQQSKGTPNVQSPMQLRVPKDIHETHYIDYVDGLPKTPSGYEHMLTVMDGFTKYLWAFPVVEANAKAAAKAYYEGVVCPHQAAKRMVMDNGQAFTSVLMKEMAQLVGSQRVFTSAYHPQSNMVERAHKTLKDSLRAMCTHPDIQKRWDQLLPTAVAAYNKSVHVSTGETPYFLMHGRDPLSAFELAIGQERTAPSSMSDYMRELIQGVAVARMMAADTLQQVRSAMIAKANAKRLHSGPQPSDLVWLWVPSLRKNASKLAPTWYGPYRVAHRPTAHTAVLQGKGGRFVSRNVHIDRLKLYVDPSVRPYQIVQPKGDTVNGPLEGWEAVDPVKDAPIEPDMVSPEQGDVSPGEATGQEPVEALPPAYVPESVPRREGLRRRAVPTQRYKPSAYAGKQKRVLEESSSTKAITDTGKAQASCVAPKSKKPRSTLSLVLSKERNGEVDQVNIHAPPVRREVCPQQRPGVAHHTPKDQAGKDHTP